MTRENSPPCEIFDSDDIPFCSLHLWEIGCTFESFVTALDVNLARILMILFYF